MHRVSGEGELKQIKKNYATYCSILCVKLINEILEIFVIIKIIYKMQRVYAPGTVSLSRMRKLPSCFAARRSCSARRRLIPRCMQFVTEALDSLCVTDISKGFRSSDYEQCNPQKIIWKIGLNININHYNNIINLKNLYQNNLLFDRLWLHWSEASRQPTEFINRFESRYFLVSQLSTSQLSTLISSHRNNDYW